MPSSSVSAAVVLLTLIAGTGSVLWVAGRRWDAATAALRDRLRAGARPPAVPIFRRAELDGLPPPVARYFTTALRDGQRIVAHARIMWTGQFNMGAPGADRWAPFTAVQDFVPGAPGMVWDARIRMAPGVAVRVRDGLIDGEGSMRGAVLGLYTVVDSRGTPALATAALQRYMGEAAWLPTALLPSQGVVWAPIDETRALATLRAGGVTASAEFRFGDDGLIASVVVPGRLYDDGKHPPVPHPWQARNLRFGEFHGMRVPAESVVEWQMPQGVYAYWRGTPVAIEYTYAAP